MPGSFSLVQALAATGRTAAAHELFTELCGLASPSGSPERRSTPPATATLATTRKPSPTPRCCKPPARALTNTTVHEIAGSAWV